MVMVQLLEGSSLHLSWSQDASAIDQEVEILEISTTADASCVCTCAVLEKWWATPPTNHLLWELSFMQLPLESLVILAIPLVFLCSLHQLSHFQEH